MHDSIPLPVPKLMPWGFAHSGTLEENSLDGPGLLNIAPQLYFQWRNLHKMAKLSAYHLPSLSVYLSPHSFNMVQRPFAELSSFTIY